MKNIFETLNENYILFENCTIEVIIDNTDKLWFNSRQLAKAIGYSDPKDAIKKHTDNTDRIQFKNINHSIKLNQHPQTVYLSEAGMYKLILRSKLEKTKKFVEWVTNDVLPSIRKFGYYKLKTQLENEKHNLLAKIDYLDKQNKLLKTDMKKTKYPDGALVYIIDYSDEDINQPGIFRLGKTANLKKRKSIYDTHMLHNKKVVLKEQCANPLQLETCLRSMLYDYRYANRKDFYICSLGVIKKAFKKCTSAIKNMNQTGGGLVSVDNIKIQVTKIDKQIEKINKVMDLKP
jgi:prophage antirepressor-like protein